MAQVAKRERQRRLIDWWIETGTLQSLIVHTIVLLLLSLYVPEQKYCKKIAIDLQFSNDQIEDINLDPLVSIEELTDKQKGAKELSDDTTLASYTEIQIEPEQLSVDGIEIPDNASVNDALPIIDNATLLASINNNSQEDIISHGSGSGNIPSGHNGTDEMGRRLGANGAKTGDIQASIIWNNTNDIDLWIMCRAKDKVDPINWQNPVGMTGGCLDIDRNANPNLLTIEPVENIFWPRGRAPYGMYDVYLHYFKQWDRRQSSTKVQIRIMYGNKIIEKTQTLTHQGQLIKIHSFKINQNTLPIKTVKSQDLLILE